MASQNSNSPAAATPASVRKAALYPALTTTKPGAAAGKVLEADDLSAVFGLDMADSKPDADIPGKAKRAVRKRRMEAV